MVSVLNIILGAFITYHILPGCVLCFEHVLFGFQAFAMNTSNHYYIIKMIIILAKFHIQVYLPELSHAFTSLKKENSKI